MGQRTTQLVVALLSKGTLTRQLSATFLVKVAGAALAIFLQIALARALAISEYGTFVYALNWVLVLAVLLLTLLLLKPQGVSEEVVHG